MGAIKTLYKKVRRYNLLYFVDNFLFILVVEYFYRREGSFTGWVESDHHQLLRYFFFGVSSLSFFLILFVRSGFLNIPFRVPVTQATQQLWFSHLVTLTIADLVAFAGLLLFLMTGLYIDFYLHLILSLFCVLVFRPKPKEEMKWIRKISKQRDL